MSREYALSSPLNGFVCPLCRQPMLDPVVAMDGLSYERQVIQQWFLQSQNQNQNQNSNSFRSPVTNLPMASNLLVPNVSLKQAIDCFKDRGGVLNPQQNSSSSTQRPSQQGVITNLENGDNTGQQLFVVGVPTNQEDASLLNDYTNGQVMNFNSGGTPSRIGTQPIGPSDVNYSIASGQIDQKTTTQMQSNDGVPWNWDASVLGKELEIIGTSTTVKRKESAGDYMEPKDLVAVSSRPIRVIMGNVMEFHVRLKETSNAWGGFRIGIVPQCDELRDRNRVFNAIDDRAFFFDSDRWFRTPTSEGNSLTQFNSGNLMANDVISLIISQDGKSIYIFKDRSNINGNSVTACKEEAKINLPVKCEVPIRESLYPFVILTGNCKSIEIGVGRPRSLKIPTDCDVVRGR